MSGVGFFDLHQFRFEVVQRLDILGVETDRVGDVFLISEALGVGQVSGGGDAVEDAVDPAAVDVVAQLFLDALAVLFDQVVERDDLAGVGAGGAAGSGRPAACPRLRPRESRREIWSA